jgi:hypothetical protein
VSLAGLSKHGACSRTQIWLNAETVSDLNVAVSLGMIAGTLDSPNLLKAQDCR